MLRSEIPQDVRNRDDKYQIFATSENDKINILSKLEEDHLIPIKHEKYLEESNNDLLKKLSPKYTIQMAERDERFEINKKFYKDEKERANSKIKYINKMISENPKISTEEINILTKLKEFNELRREYFTNKFNNESEKNKFMDIKSIDKSIYKLEDQLRKKGGRGVFTYKNKFVKLLILLTQLLTSNSSKKLISDIEQLTNNLYDNKKITKQVCNILNKALRPSLVL